MTSPLAEWPTETHLERHLRVTAAREAFLRRAGLVREVVCELCLQGLHRRCVRPCTCRTDHKPSAPVEDSDG